MILRPVTQLPPLGGITGLYMGITNPGNATALLPNGAGQGLDRLYLFGAVTEEFHVPRRGYKEMERDPGEAFKQFFQGDNFFAKGVQALTSNVPSSSLEDLAHYLALLMGVEEVCRRVCAAVPKASKVYLNCDPGPRPLNPRTRNGLWGRTIQLTGPGYLLIGTISINGNGPEKAEEDPNVPVASRYL
ncbi:MAG: hypothetical protein AABX70_07325 [Nanoarchaeota archaeon]